MLLGVPDQQPFLDKLIALLGPEGVDLNIAERRFFSEDSHGRRGRNESFPYAEPLAVVRPADASTTAQVLQLASEHGVPVVPYGAGTGLMGGARSTRPGIVLDTVRMNGIEVQAGDRFVWAGSGAILADIDAALRKDGLCLGHDPWTFPVATVGGTLSTNSLGYKGGRYGGMGDQAIALEVALADGTVVRTRAVRRSSTGPRLERLFIGAEGVLGVITAAALQGHGVPETTELRAFTFAKWEDGFHAIDEMMGLGLRPALLDFGEEHASPWPDLVSRDDEPPILYLGFEGWREEVEASIARAERIVLAHGGQGEPQSRAQRFWDDRHVVAERFARTRRQRRDWRSPDVAFDYIHVALPPSKVLDFRAVLHEASARREVGLLECGLWTAPDFFSAVLALPAAGDGHERLARAIDGFLTQVQQFGGSMEYVHGAGLRYAHLMPQEHASDFEVLRRIKAALDPAGIINPGKLGL
jgi:FAD/FMN-containing dehydrogenase